MKNKIILHLPHFSTKVPKKFWNNVRIEKQKVFNFIYETTDLDSEKLYGKNHYKKIYPKYSRVFCDVEKFVNDNVEVMAKYGMGVVYTKTNKGENFINVSNDYKNFVLNKFYYPYHEKLDNICKKALKNNPSVILVDCHTFGKEIVMDKSISDFPDICIGFNQVYNKTLIDFINEYFKNLNYKIGLNYPYSGSMVPNYYIKNPNKNLHCVMLETNKTAYLYDKQKFKKLRSEINVLLKKLENIDL